MVYKLHYIDAIFLYGQIYNLSDYSIHKVTINMFFALSYKICKIL